MGIRTRLIAATVAAATLTALASTAIAAAAPASPTTSAPSGDKGDKKGDKGDKKERPDKDATVAKVAASLHVSVQQLVTALDHLKQAVGNGTSKDAAVGAFAKELKVSLARAEQALRDLSSDDKQKPKPDKDKDKDKQPGVPEEQVVKLLATELHVSADRAGQVLKDLDKINGKGGDPVKDPAFIAIAKGLGITPQQLLAALVAVKQQLGGKPKEEVPSGSPTK
jgi:hypothetical protein